MNNYQEIYTIQPKDVSKGRVEITCHCCGHKETINTYDLMGLIQPWDVGRKIFRSIVENRQGGENYRMYAIGKRKEVK